MIPNWVCTQIVVAQVICGHPRPPLSERWFSDLVLYCELFLSPLISVASAQHHEYTFVIFQAAITMLLCVLVTLVLKRKSSPVKRYIWALLVAVISGLLLTNTLFILRVMYWP